MQNVKSCRLLDIYSIPILFHICLGPFLWKCLYQVRVITFFPVFRLLTDFVCSYTYEFWLSLWNSVRSSIMLLLPLSTHSVAMILTNFVHIPVSVVLLVAFPVYRNDDFVLNAFCSLIPWSKHFFCFWI
jgi:hypothetical protein